MLFHVAERIHLLNLLPAEGDITTLRIVRQLREALSFSEAEHTDFAMQVEGGRVTWDAAKAGAKDVEVGEKARSIIGAALQRASEAGKLSSDLVAVYDACVDEPAPVEGEVVA